LVNRDPEWYKRGEAGESSKLRNLQNRYVNVHPNTNNNSMLNRLEITTLQFVKYKTMNAKDTPETFTNYVASSQKHSVYCTLLSTKQLTRCCPQRLQSTNPPHFPAPISWFVNESRFLSVSVD